MKTLLLAISFCFITIFGLAQMPKTAPINKQDVEKFIKTYPSIVKELEVLGEKFDKMNEVTALQALSGNSQVQGVLSKYGWNDQWLGKWMTVTLAYSLAKVEEQLAALPADQRQMAAQYMGASTQQFKTLVTDDDVALVRNYSSQLDVVFDQQ